jgi:tetratricopeptide (TPR) repeat protein
LGGRYFYKQAASVLKAELPKDDPGQAAEMTLQRYRDALRTLERAAAFEPSRAAYWKAQADIHLRMGTWMKVLESMGETLPAGATPSAESFQKTESALQEAIKLDPVNADHHFALAALYDAMDNLSGKAEKELEVVIKAYPVNAERRNAVAVQHLLNGRPGQALEQATALARLVDAAEMGPAREHLFAAFEIAWRATKDVQVVQGLCPDEPKALKILDEYMKQKGLNKS